MQTPGPGLSPLALRWLQVAAQTPDIHVALGCNIAHGYTHKPQMPRCGSTMDADMLKLGMLPWPPLVGQISQTIMEPVAAWLQLHCPAQTMPSLVSTDVTQVCYLKAAERSNMVTDPGLPRSIWWQYRS